MIDLKLRRKMKVKMSGKEEELTALINEDDIDDSPNEARRNLALDQDEGQHSAEINRLDHVVFVSPEVRRSVWLHVNVGLKVFFLVLSIPWFISVMFFSIFDTQCIVFEQSSVINCSQHFFISNPKDWIFTWLVMSILSSVLLITIIRLNRKEMNYQSEKAKKIYRKGSFWSLIFLLIACWTYYVFRVLTRSDEIGTAISVLILLWCPVSVAVLCCLNYLPRVQWKRPNTSRYTLQWCKNCLTRNSNFFIYWLALVLYFAESSSELAAVMLDVAHEVAPLIENKFPETSGRLRGVMVVLIGLRLGFYARLVSFYWQKIFNGKEDQLEEPNSKLVDEPQWKDQGSLKENTLKETVFA